MELEVIDPYRGEASQDLFTAMDRYLELSEQIREMENEKKALGVAIGTAIEDTPEQRFEHKAANVAFLIRNRITYDYSPAVAGMEAQLKAAKKEEENNGTASVKKHTWFVTTQRVTRGHQIYRQDHRGNGKNRYWQGWP